MLRLMWPNPDRHGGPLAVRITAGNLRLYGNPASHQGRLILTAWRLGNHPHSDFQALRRWAHMLGCRGHFATKSRRYSTTMRALRAARRDWHRRQKPLSAHRCDETVITITDLEWAGRGWRTAGDASWLSPPPPEPASTAVLPEKK